MEHKLLMRILTTILGERLLNIKPSRELLESYVNVAINNEIYGDLYKYLMDNGASEKLLRKYLSF